VSIPKQERMENSFPVPLHSNRTSSPEVKDEKGGENSPSEELNHSASSENEPNTPSSPNGETRKAGRRKINIEFIEDKSRRHITFSKRKAGIMKKAYELSTLTGTQVLLLVASETGHVYTFATPKLQPLITKPDGKNLIQGCLNAPDPPSTNNSTSQQQQQQRMSQAGYQEPNLMYSNNSDNENNYEDEKKPPVQDIKQSIPNISGVSSVSGVDMPFPNGYPTMMSPMGMYPISSLNSLSVPHRFIPTYPTQYSPSQFAASVNSNIFLPNVTDSVDGRKRASSRNASKSPTAPSEPQ